MSRAKKYLLLSFAFGLISGVAFAEQTADQVVAMLKIQHPKVRAELDSANERFIADIAKYGADNDETRAAQWATEKAHAKLDLIDLVMKSTAADPHYVSAILESERSTSAQVVNNQSVSPSDRVKAQAKLELIASVAGPAAPVTLVTTNIPLPTTTAPNTTTTVTNTVETARGPAAGPGKKQDKDKDKDKNGPMFEDFREHELTKHEIEKVVFGFGATVRGDKIVLMGQTYRDCHSEDELVTFSVEKESSGIPAIIATAQPGLAECMMNHRKAILDKKDPNHVLGWKWDTCVKVGSTVLNHQAECDDLSKDLTWSFPADKAGALKIGHADPEQSNSARTYEDVDSTTYKGRTLVHAEEEEKRKAREEAKIEKAEKTFKNCRSDDSQLISSRSAVETLKVLKGLDDDKVQEMYDTLDEAQLKIITDKIAKTKGDALDDLKDKITTFGDNHSRMGKQTALALYKLNERYKNQKGATVEDFDKAIEALEDAKDFNPDAEDKLDGHIRNTEVAQLGLIGKFGVSNNMLFQAQYANLQNQFVHGILDNCVGSGIGIGGGRPSSECTSDLTSFRNLNQTAQKAQRSEQMAPNLLGELGLGGGSANNGMAFGGLSNYNYTGAGTPYLYNAGGQSFGLPGVGGNRTSIF